MQNITASFAHPNSFKGSHFPSIVDHNSEIKLFTEVNMDNDEDTVNSGGDENLNSLPQHTPITLDLTKETAPGLVSSGRPQTEKSRTTKGASQ